MTESKNNKEEIKNESNLVNTNNESKGVNSQKQCKSCFQMIHISAKVCRYCGRSQNRCMKFFQTIPVLIPLVMAIIAAISLSVIGAEPNQIKKEALDQLLDEAQKAHSDALVIFKDGKQYGQWYFGKKPDKIEAMSATKSVVNLAIGRLLTQGKIKSVDQPVYEFYPEWNQGRKKNITIKHILNHTSGLQNNSQTTGIEIYPSPDFVQLALAAELSDDPGTVFSYNNKAVNLLAGIVKKASGKRMDLYIRDEIFTPLGITDYSWTLDKVGNPHAMAGLQILPSDFAKLGQLVLNKGKWNDRQIIAESWFDISFRPGQQFVPTCGLLWWLIPDHIAYIIDDEQISNFTAKGVNADFINKVKLLKGRYESEDELQAALQKVFGDQWQQQVMSVMTPLSLSLAKKEFGNKIAGYYAEGYLGQYLVILPPKNLIIVRMINWFDGYNEKTDGFDNIKEMALKLVN
jgi:CubicO group peptidase (beta-lactamase class C family)